MKTSYFVATISLLLVPTNGQGLIEILDLNGFTKFSTALQLDPELLYEISCQNSVIMWAPINEAAGFDDLINGNGSRIFRRDGNTTVGIQGSIDKATGTTNPTETTTPKTATKKKRNFGSLPDSNAEVLETFFRNTAYVNLGPHEPARIVQNYAAPTPGSREASLEVKSGLGISKKLSGPFKYDQGIIYGVNRFFDLPLPLIDSLSILGLTTFIDAITAGRLTQKLSDTTAMTIFAFQNFPTTPSVNINEYTITGFLGFSPGFTEEGSLVSDAGTKLKFSFYHGSYFVNGIRIIRTDMTIKNGVLHLLEKPFSEAGYESHTSCGCNDTTLLTSSYATITSSGDYGTTSSSLVPSGGLATPASPGGNITTAPTPVPTYSTGSAARYGPGSVAFFGAIIAIIGWLRV
ncbi:hypothetical protein BDD12DRAFT_801508 [Trichophaea hybrida]|nr:hypothetical protein BDD12DRAFT_801508 [Trichophaea hybrida]